MICDDVRKEDNNKELIIGLYTDDIIIPSLPALLPILTFRVVIRATKPVEWKILFEVIGPENEGVWLKGGTNINIADPQKRVVMIHPVVPAVFKVEGEYRVALGINGKPKKIGAFMVKQGQVPAR